MRAESIAAARHYVFWQYTGEEDDGTEVTAGGSLWEGGTSVMMPEPEYSLSKDPGEITGL